MEIKDGKDERPVLFRFSYCFSLSIFFFLFNYCFSFSFSSSSSSLHHHLHLASYSDFIIPIFWLTEGSDWSYVSTPFKSPVPAARPRSFVVCMIVFIFTSDSFVRVSSFRNFFFFFFLFRTQNLSLDNFSSSIAFWPIFLSVVGFPESHFGSFSCLSVLFTASQFLSPF